MKKNIIGILILFALAFTACAYPKKTKKKKAKATPVAAANTGAHQITGISLFRGACFGRCPTYVVKVSQDGLVEYEGRMFTKNDGMYQKNVGVPAVNELFKEFMAFRVDTCKAEYPVPISDVAGIYFKLIIDGKEQRISNANFGPRFLSNLANSVDNISQVDNTWKKVSDSTGNRW